LTIRPVNDTKGSLSDVDDRHDKEDRFVPQLLVYLIQVADASNGLVAADAELIAMEHVLPICLVL
jgi:hypothetical protein